MFRLRSDVPGAEIDPCVENSEQEILTLIAFKLSGESYGRWFDSDEVRTFSRQYRKVNRYLVYLRQEGTQEFPRSNLFDTGSVQKYQITEFLDRIDEFIEETEKQPQGENLEVVFCMRENFV